jgi:hypothetical protein
MRWRNDGSGCKLPLRLPRNEKEVHLVEAVEVKEGDEVTGILSLSRLENPQVEREANLCGGTKLQILLDYSLKGWTG